jgi:hypothetical protein
MGRMSVGLVIQEQVKNPRYFGQYTSAPPKVAFPRMSQVYLPGRQGNQGSRAAFIDFLKF